ncbi:hypothetical protein [Roseiconus lacunae]|uniref:hypothetical protein n=1 Tax=Roseiconus lacunae TaxID=2605694 RepID=UPI001E3BB3EE|nr:hypothetical protein [Roseiconus lacunae]MCD0458610.1 hypothetical protein [Roseiconus lacunae]
MENSSFHDTVVCILDSDLTESATATLADAFRPCLPGPVFARGDELSKYPRKIVTREAVKIGKSQAVRPGGFPPTCAVFNCEQDIPKVACSFKKGSIELIEPLSPFLDCCYGIHPMTAQKVIPRHTIV